ncbi:hypothetical protein BKA82DRAFT_19908 [Pisolithus tinctorius]|uniref:Uncharacterized protein n=1 Tax=Pisolithus tinctorius Marx 270 TaxID=870435 RepID=A0A0C3PSF8_PISTI|nr:hypothetical protein BKA82DRAFT_19908 [Pisolithus tinctorius]KIO12076.1 hypothetical protein M404DRAFT_19908 [Pisolithus tinctorius Marx 270]
MHGMACKGIRCYAPYNLRSHGPNQTFLDLSSLPSTPRAPVHLCNAIGACAGVPAPHIHAAEGNPFANTNQFIYPDIRRAIHNGILLEEVGFGVKLRFIQDCLELAKVVDEEQKKIRRALDAGEVILQERLAKFGQDAVSYVKGCMEIAGKAMADEMHKCEFSAVTKDLLLTHFGSMLSTHGTASTSKT